MPRIAPYRTCHIRLGSMWMAAVALQLAPSPMPIMSGIRVSGPRIHQIPP